MSLHLPSIATGQRQASVGGPSMFVLFALYQAIVFAVMAWSSAAWAVPTVSEASIDLQRQGTRVVLSLSAKVPYETFTLEHPDRVVIDLPEVRWGLRSAVELQTDGLVTQIRHGRFKPGTSRVVIDCRSPVSIRQVAMRPADGAWRLTIDLDGKGSAPAVKSAEAETVAVSAAGNLPVTADASSDGRLQPVIGATGLAVGDVGPVQRNIEPVKPEDASPMDARVVGATLAFAIPVPRPTAPRRTATPLWVVAIDPGHGGQDPGAIGVSGVYEKQLTLAMARNLRDELQSLGRYKVVLTRNRDVFIELRNRIAIARAAGADLFLSLHADKMDNAAVRGLSIYTLSERASDAEAAALAEKENKVDMLGGVHLRGETTEVTNILIDLVQRDTMNQSAQMAALLVRELQKETMLLPKTHRFAGFAVLKAPDVPSALLELGYLSNPADEALLRSQQHQRKLARAIARAIDSYFVSFQARNRL